MANTVFTPDPSSIPQGSNAEDLLYDKIQDFILKHRPKQEDFATLKLMFYSMVGRTSASARRKYSIALAHNHYVPRQLLLFLALDKIDIATPVLLYSPALNERDFAAIIARKGLDHAKIIARRGDLTPSLVATLRHSGEAVASILDRNENLPENIAPETVEIEEPVSEEKEMTPEIVEPIQAATTKSIASTASQDLLALAGRGGKLGRSQPPVRKPNNDPHVVARGMLEAARGGKLMEFCICVERVTGLGAGKLAPIVRDEDAGILASLFHLMRLPKDLSARLLLMLCPKTGRSFDVFKRIMQHFETLDDTASLAYFKALDPGFELKLSRHHIVAPVPEYIPMLRERRSAIGSRQMPTRNQELRQAS